MLRCSTNFGKWALADIAGRTLRQPCEEPHACVEGMVRFPAWVVAHVAATAQAMKPGSTQYIHKFMRFGQMKDA